MPINHLLYQNISNKTGVWWHSGSDSLLALSVRDDELHCRTLFATACIDTVSCTSTLYCLTMHLTLVELFISTSKNYTMVTKSRGCGSIDEAPGTYATYSYWGLGVTDAHNYLLVQCVSVQFTIAYEQLRLMAL